MLALALASACSSAEERKSAHIGILIGSAGSKSSTLRPVYDWSIGVVNDSGGAGGRVLEARYFELTPQVLASKSAQEALAEQILSDPDMVAVAGQFSFAMAPKFVAANLPYVTPETGDDDVFRAFSAGGYVWRTLESDSTQLWFMLAEAKGRGEKLLQTKTTTGLLTSTDSYGDTFFDWYGFHAAELGLSAMPPVRYDQDEASCENAVDQLLSQGTPDFLIAVPSGNDPVAQATCMVRTMKSRGAKSQILFADSVHTPTLLSALGTDAEGLAGFHAAPDPSSGFSEAFTNKTKLAEPPEHAANTLDAIALIAYGLEKSEGQGHKALDTAIRAVVDGRGPATNWSDFKLAMQLIRDGQSPDIAGASGPLSFDHELYTDPTASFYDRWTVQNGAFVTTHHVTTETQSSPNVYSQSAVSRGLKALQPDKPTGGGGTPDLPALAENWALVIATSATWQNYRHQADALAQYQALKANGFDDAHVLLITVDDLAAAPENLRPGQVLNAQDGPNVRANAVDDYPGVSLTPEQLMTVLEGGNDPSLPQVLHSTAQDNVYLFIVGHGDVDGPYLGMDPSSSAYVDYGRFLTPILFSRTVQRMKLNGQFRRMLIAVEACHSGILGAAFEELAIPDVALLTGAGPAENSFAANYSSELASWTADQFAFSLVSHMHNPGLSMSDLYTQLYEQVAGSHVQLANQQNFGKSGEIVFSEFVTRPAR